MKESNDISLNLSSKIEVVERALNETIRSFKDLVLECELMQKQSQSFRSQFIAQNEQCARQCCSGSEELKKIIKSKDNTIQLAASAITKLSETKNFNIIADVFKILFGDIKYDHDVGRIESISDNIDMRKMSIISPKAEPVSLMSVQDESVSEIESTPTGRHSPIIESKVPRNLTPNRNERDKKKCPDNWITSHKKTLKLTYPTPTKGKGSGRLRQQRLQLVKEKRRNVVDLTCSPLLHGSRGSQGSQGEDSSVTNIKQNNENDDTILPSPTSGSIFCPMFKSMTTESPQKFKTPLSLKRDKEWGVAQMENVNKPAEVTNVPQFEVSLNLLDQYQHGFKSTTPKIEGPNKLKRLLSLKRDRGKSSVQGENQENKPSGDITYAPELEESVNLLKQFQNGYRFSSPAKHKEEKKSPIITNDSMSLLQGADILADNDVVILQNYSPSKRPLAENVNHDNACDIDASMSILRRDIKPVKVIDCDKYEETKKPKPIIQEHLYKEPSVRKKAEKRALPGWSCDECKNFYAELYMDNPVMLAKKMEDCSKHRGRNNPARPKTPPGYWNPRWDVPDDTEEFNRMNNAV